MQKDYWNISKRNFRAMGIISCIFVIIFGLGFFDSTNSHSVKMGMLGSLVFFAITLILYFIIASMFKKRSPKAILVSYIYLSLAFLFSLANNFILNSPSEFTDGILPKLLGYIVLLYLFLNVYKASKQNTVTQTPVQNIS